MHIAYDHNWIRVVDGVISREFCDHLIEKFEDSQPKLWRRTDYARLWELNLYSTNYRPYSAMDLIQGRSHGHDFTAECEQLVTAVYSAVGDYREHWDRFHSFPEDFSMEGFRIKCYRAGSGDHFPIHTDSGSREMSTRFLAMLFYLNDSDAGTEFPLENLLVEAKQGRVVIFPPGLQWPHRGLEPVQGDKYILSTYLHYQ